MDSFEDLDSDLLETRERVRRFDYLAGQRTAAGGQIREVAQLIGSLETQLAKEERDVTRLEKGFRGVLAGLVGAKEEHLARERAEAVAAAERLHGQRARVVSLQADLDGIERELASLAGAHDAYQRLLAEKERRLVQLGDPRGRELLDLTRKLADTESDLKEYGEAWQAGNAAGQALSQVLALLGGAQGASTWDLLGGGVISDAIEHDRLTQADQAAWHAQRALDVFARELADVGWAANPRLPKVDTRWFVDTFFDNIITDALKHQRINKTRNEVASTAQWASETTRALAAHRDQLTHHRATLHQQREHLLTR
ncbi:hypothetical protein [Nonomuraea sediminis]|uniref:hypothetical protein n=1 Tax=Nonomuraea sediminis TaxID=2835864 RepID=UPI001BDCEB15|nr:hypothetical protein [Nonomuraea sediminis]